MKFSKKYLLVIPALAIASVMAVDTAYTSGLTLGGHGRINGQKFGGMGMEDPDKFVEHLNQQASLLGVSIDEMKTFWSEGKGINEIATEKGITKEQLQAKMKAAHDVKMATSLKTLVEKGIITQAQADARQNAIKILETKHSEQMRIGINNKGQHKGQK